VGVFNLVDVLHQDQSGRGEEFGGELTARKTFSRQISAGPLSLVVFRAFSDFADLVPHCLPEPKDPPDFQLGMAPL
jgi:hypothetical protein